ncbi:Auxin-induced protein 5NG4 [Hordeum vulgare]|nr:Auxin-induced protein 5NG4 [Hordeum vulgare]
MNYNGPTFRFPPIVPERRYPAGADLEIMLRVWEISRWRGSRELAQAFLRVGFGHLPMGSPVMFHLEEMRPNASFLRTALLANFTNHFDAFYILGKVFWYGREFIAFTIYNISPTSRASSLPSTLCTTSPTTSARTTLRRTIEDGAKGMPVCHGDGVALAC